MTAQTTTATTTLSARRGARLIGALAARGSAAVVQLLLGIIVARIAGEQGAGTFYVFTATALVLGTAAALGFPVSTMRAVSESLALGHAAHARESWKRALWLATFSSLVAAAVTFVFARNLARIFNTGGDGVTVMKWAAVATIAFVATTVSTETLKALHRASVAILVQFAFAPAMASAYALVTLLRGQRANIFEIIAVYVVGMIAAAMIAAMTVWSSLRRTAEGRVTGAPARVLGDAEALLSALRVWFVNLLVQALTNAPVMFVAHFATAADAGVFGAATRIVAVATLLLIGIASVYSPPMAAAYARGDAPELATLLGETQLYSLVCYAPFLIVMIAAPTWLLNIFGHGFERAAPALMILALGQLVNAGTGIVTFFNLMTRRERQETIIGVSTLLYLFSAGAILSARLGVTGMAIATASALACKNLASYAVARHTIRTMRLRGGE